MKEIDDGRTRGAARQSFGSGGGGAPEALGGGGRADEHSRATGKLANGLGWAEGGRSKGLHGEVGAAAAAMARGGARAYWGELDSARGWEGSGEGGRERVLCERKGKERGEGAGRPARHIVAVALRAAILGVRAGRQRRVARPRDFGEKPGAGKAVLAGGSAHGRPAVGAGARRRHGEKQRGGRRDGGEGNFVINSKFQNSSL